MGLSAPWGSPVMLCAVDAHLLPSRLRMAGISACYAVNPVVISPIPGDPNALHPLGTLEGPRKENLSANLPHLLKDCFLLLGSKWKTWLCTSSLYASVCLFMCNVGCWVVLVLWSEPLGTPGLEAQVIQVGDSCIYLLKNSQAFRNDCSTT